MFFLEIVEQSSKKNLGNKEKPIWENTRENTNYVRITKQNDHVYEVYDCNESFLTKNFTNTMLYSNSEYFI
jgi:hypothetical protein